MSGLKFFLKFLILFTNKLIYLLLLIKDYLEIKENLKNKRE